MFWSSAGTSSNIDKVLEEPDVTLENVLEQDEVLSELRAMNKKLIDYLYRPESIKGMIELVTREPSGDLPLAVQYKLPSVACEVLTSEAGFIEKITGDISLLEKLSFFFRDSQQPINPLLSSFVCRILSEIITRKLDQNWYSYQLNLIQIMGYLQSESGGDVLGWLMNHLDCSSVCDFFYKLIMNVEGQDMRASLYSWIVEREKLLFQFVKKFTSEEDSDVHANLSRLFGDLLCGFQDEMQVNSSQERNSDADPFLLALRSPELISALLNTMFSSEDTCESSIVHGLDLLLSLLGITNKSPRQSGRNDSLDEENNNITLSTEVKREITSRLENLTKLLQDAEKRSQAIPMTYGLLEKPVGLGRLAVAKFIAHLFTLEDDELNTGMISSGVLKHLLDLFWSHPWNNFLHRYVCKIMTCVAKSAQITPSSASYLMDMDVLSKILEVFENKELKCGYRGHLAKVASVWGEAATIEGGSISKLMHELEENNKDLYTKWDIFCSDTLESYLSDENTLLAGVNPPASGVLGNSAALPYEGGDIIGNDTSQMQWLNSSSGVLNADFEPSDSVSLLNLSLSMSGANENDDSQRARSIFELFCNERNNSFDDDDDEEESELKKTSGDLGSPDGDKAFNSFNSSAGQDDLFEMQSPPATELSVMGSDPWSNPQPDTLDTSSSNPDPGTKELDDFGEWAKFEDAGKKEDWANFESANCSEEQLQSAKDETVSASQQVSATN